VVLPPPQKSAQPGRSLRVVVADDDRDAVLTLATLLQDEGHQVLEVYRGDAVVQLVRKYRPDAVLLDIGMPGLTGFEIARRLREDLRDACPLLIAVTAWSQTQARELGRLSGFHHYILKPYATDELLALLERLG
jgi:two-component system, OmpR family, response regulator